MYFTMIEVFLKCLRIFMFANTYKMKKNEFDRLISVNNQLKNVCQKADYASV